MDILYVFNFERQHLEKAVVRFRHSLASVADKSVRICVSNNSDECILSQIEDVADNLAYVHRPYTGQFSRAHGINFGVRSLVRSEYFIISDVDLIYQQNHFQIVRQKLEKASLSKTNYFRIVFWNYNLLPRYNPVWMNKRFWRRFAFKSPAFESSDYSALAQLPHNGGDYAHGNGVVHLESFMRLRGYDEDMIGYGPEDDLFNTRIGKLNSIIYDRGENTASIHLWHPRLREIQLRKNMRIWRERKAFYNSLVHPDWSDLMANKGSANWGQIL